MDRIIQMWTVNAESGSYFSNVDRKAGMWIVIINVKEFWELETVILLLLTVESSRRVKIFDDGGSFLLIVSEKQSGNRPHSNRSTPNKNVRIPLINE
ncbi:hypothetical protein AAEO50_02780 [Rossellomorea oryzaecorticis]|uniref:Uncharacterized protein n=1 Tax=Rossellomorea oryzaecorticis TaxID=1396505 RepID=A0ABU9K5B8_9BACI